MRVSSDYRVTIPVKIRRELGMLPGTELDYVIRGDEVEIFKAETKRPLRLKPKRTTGKRSFE